jgi:hypothetical protein
MRKYALLFLAFLLMTAGVAAPAFAGNPYVATALVTGGVVADNTTSAAVAIPKAAQHLEVYVPTITSSTVFLLVSGDGGTTYAEYRSTPNGTNMILTGPAAGTGDLTFNVVGGIGGFTHLKVKCGTAQAADRTFKLLMW